MHLTSLQYYFKKVENNRIGFKFFKIFTRLKKNVLVLCYIKFDRVQKIGRQWFRVLPTVIDIKKSYLDFK